MTNPPSFPPHSEALPFGFAGPVTVWDRMSAERPGNRHAHLSGGPGRRGVAGLAAGVIVIVTGYVDRPAGEGARWIVTEITLG